ncbi:MAG: class I SAM-dependent methyltransferase [Acidobacteria bacterium]|nr:class I SAM-dependent methyltransferase [Acidobacteriota bacterium]MBV9187955.1 class I SAM-dependent methyltransferase [Acidobacteriota bacterium]
MTPHDVAGEFDAIASLTPRDRLAPHAGWLLRQIPHCNDLLDAGCGLGLTASIAADRAAHVTGIDLSPVMIARARRDYGHRATFEVADFLEYLPAHPESFDCIISLAALHHVDAATALPLMASALRSGGTLLILDILDRRGILNLPVNAFAAAVSVSRRILFRQRWSRELNAAWNAHGRGERYESAATLPGLREILPGARIRRHLIWRYSLIWTKP